MCGKSEKQTLNLGKRYAVFDMDGTLIDSNGMLVGLVRDYLIRHAEEPTEELIQKLLPLTMSQCCELLREVAGDGRSVDDVIQEINAQAAWRYDNEVPAKPFVPEYLDCLKANGITMAVASATEHAQVCRVLERLGLMDYFEFVLSVEEVGHTKEEPHIFREAARRLGCTCEEITVYEDSVLAMASARQAGCNVVAVYDDLCRDKREEASAVSHCYVDSFRELF